jgi:hypothetical protein
MSDQKFSLELKMTYRGGRKPPPFWQRYWQHVAIAITVAAIWFALRQF